VNTDNRITLKRIKSSLGKKDIIISLIAVIILSVTVFITVENLERRELFVWLVTTDGEYGLDDGVPQSLNDYGRANGINRVVITRRHPEDRYFDVLMSTGAFYNCDVFIMKSEVAEKYAPLDMYMSLEEYAEIGEDPLLIDGRAVGVAASDGYYILVNRKTSVKPETVFGILDILVEK
jgi:hypothetical protein